MSHDGWAAIRELAQGIYQRGGSTINPSKQSVDLRPDSINELARGFWHSAILRAGLKLGVFPLLDSNSLTSNEVAQQTGASPSYVQAFLDSCVVLDLLEKRADSYIDSPLASRLLVAGKKEYVGDHALHHTNTWLSWGQLDTTSHGRHEFDG